MIHKKKKYKHKYYKSGKKVISIKQVNEKYEIKFQY